MTDHPPSSHPRAIDLGDGGNLTPDSAEVARIWVTDRGGASVWIDAGLLDDPKVFGYLMADTMRHAAQAYAEKTGRDADVMLRLIADGAAEMVGGPMTGALDRPERLN